MGTVRIDGYVYIAYNACMEHKHTRTMRIWVQTLACLRVIRAYTGESQVAIIERLARAEAHRLHGPTLPDGTGAGVGTGQRS